MIKRLLFLFICSAAFAQTNVFPKQDTGSEANKPTSCTPPSFYLSTDTENFYICKVHSYVLFTGGSTPPSAPAVSVAPSVIHFGTVQTGTASPEQNITINNPGTSPIVVLSAILSGSGDFASSNLNVCNGSLPAGATCVIQVHITPSSSGAKNGTMTITTTAVTDLPLAIALDGSGTAAVTFPLTINGSGTGAGSVTSDEATPLINVSFNPPGAPLGIGSNNYATGSVVTLTATPANGHTFTGYTGGGCGTNPVCAVTVSAATVITATFTAPIPQFVASVICQGQGTGTVTSNVNDVLTGTPISTTCTAGVPTGKFSGTFNQGTAITFTESPSGGCTGGACTFTSWGGLLGCSNASTCLATINSTLNLTATFAAPPAGAPLSLIQVTNGSNGGAGSVSATFASAQGVANTNIVCGFWTGVGTVTSLTDTKGNSYIQSSCSPKAAGGLTMVAYHASNILAAGAGTNAVTAAITTTPSFLRLFALEYTGLTATPVDTCAGSTGTGTAVSSGNLTTGFAGDLLTACSLVANQLSGVPAGWTRQIFPTNSADAEDFQGVAIGTYANAPTQNTSGNWIDIAEAWKVSGGSTPTSFTFSVACSGSGSGTVASAGISLTCTNGVPSGTSSTSVALNSTQTLTATPQSGSAFTSYVGAGCSTSPTCLSNAINANTLVTATFSLAGVAQYFVNSSTGSNSNSGLCAVAGTPAGCTGPWATIQKADTAIVLGSNGTQVNVASGSYAGPVTTNKSGNANQRIIYVSTTPKGAALNPSNWLMVGSYTDVNNFDMTSPGSGGTCIGTNGGSSISSVGSFEKILNNYCHDTSTSSCPSAGAIYTNGTQSPPLQSTDNLVSGNIIRHGGTAACRVFHGIYADGPRDIVSNNSVSGFGGNCIQRASNGPGTPFTGVISNNLIFNCGGGINVSEQNNAGTQAQFDYHTINNNIIVNNGVSGAGTPAYGMNWYHVTGTHNVFQNNLVYGNLPGDFAHHDGLCGTSASGSTPAVGTPITGTDATGTGGCPSSNAKTDSGGTGATFTAFQSDTNAAPAGAFNITNYKLKAPSNGVNTGTTLCAAAPGLQNCVPLTAIDGVARPQGPAFDIGVFEQ